MGIISDIKKSAQKQIAPKLDISKDDQEKLKRGEVVLVSDNESGESYLIRIDSDKIGSGSISKIDLIIENVKRPVAAKPQIPEL
jgi:hypothetical protein